MPDPLPRQSEPVVRCVITGLCDLCLDGTGGECHVPGCALYMNRAPDVPIRPHVEILTVPYGPAYRD